MKVVINACHGGFGLSKEAENKYKELAGISNPNFYSRSIARDDEHLITVVEQMGSKACGGYADLKIMEIPDDVDWYIEEYDGKEWVAEKHRIWE